MKFLECLFKIEGHDQLSSILINTADIVYVEPGFGDSYVALRTKVEGKELKIIVLESVHEISKALGDDSIILPGVKSRYQE
jgi:predicted NAD-dependent protein-ADP-ribosyltransferase YbiA (DUF1768 family)